jgi:hypothetical protein
LNQLHGRVDNPKAAGRQEPYVEDVQLQKWKLGAAHPRANMLEFLSLTDCLGPFTQNQSKFSLQRYGQDTEFLARIIYKYMGSINDEIRQIFTKVPLDISENVRAKLSTAFVETFVAQPYILDCISPYRDGSDTPRNKRDQIIEQQQSFARDVFDQYVQILTYKPPQEADTDSSSSE